MPKGIGRTGKGVAPRILDVLVEHDEFSTFLTLLERSNLHDFLEHGSQSDMHEFFDAKTDLTVFAPKNSAFEQLETVSWDQLVDPGNREGLRRLLKRHIVPESFPRHRFRDRKIETLGGWKAPLEVDGDTIIFAGARVTKTDVKCEDGLIHHVTGVAFDGDTFGGP